MEDRAEVSVAQLSRRTRVTAQSLSPILHRLEYQGWAESRAIQTNPASRRVMRFYKLTAKGRREGRKHLAEATTP